MVRVLLAGALAGAALFAPAASAQQVPAECTAWNPCYECVMYPCYPSDWPPYLVDRATYLCQTALYNCPL